MWKKSLLNHCHCLWVVISLCHCYCELLILHKLLLKCAVCLDAIYNILLVVKIHHLKRGKCLCYRYRVGIEESKLIEVNGKLVDFHLAVGVGFFCRHFDVKFRLTESHIIACDLIVWYCLESRIIEGHVLLTNTEDVGNNPKLSRLIVELTNKLDYLVNDSAIGIVKSLVDSS